MEILTLTEFVVVTACACHDAQNAFKWSMQDLMVDTALLRDIYVGIESLRNSFDIPTAHIGEWVALRLSFS